MQHYDAVSLHKFRRWCLHISGDPAQISSKLHKNKRYWILSFLVIVQDHFNVKIPNKFNPENLRFFLKRFPEKMVRNAKKPQVISGLSSKKYTLVKPHRMPFFPSLADFLEFFQNFFETLVHYVKKPRAFFYSTARNFKNTIFRMHQDFSCSF